MAKRDFKADLRRMADALRDPLRLRLAICGVSALVAYFGIYGPLGDHIARASRRLDEAKKREAAAQATIVLRAQVAAIQPRLGPDPDPNECIQYVLDGARALPIKLDRLDSRGVVAMGPYEAVSLALDVTGPMEHLDALVAWLETNRRLIRVESARIEPPREEGDPALRLQMLILKVHA